uniref:Uncharacterized protein n=1 Tax=Anabas testudineus TaxID=64144 RepID=A0A7N5ZYE9_ANATE
MLTLFHVKWLTREKIIMKTMLFKCKHSRLVFNITAFNSIKLFSHAIIYQDLWRDSMLPLCSAKTRPVFTPLVFCFSTVLPLLLASQAWCNGNAEGTEVMFYVFQD